MGVGLVVYDVLFLLFATLVYGGAVTAGVRAFLALSSHVPWPFAIVPSLFVALLSLIAEVFVATSFCPPLKPGRYRMMKSVTFYSWLFRSMFRRLLFDCGLRWLLFSSSILRFFAFRALGAKVHFTASMSSDVTVLDPSLLIMGKGSMMGARCFIAGHFIERNRLILGYVEIGEGSLLAVDVICAPGIVIGKNVTVKGNSSIAPYVHIDDGADIGPVSLLDAGARIGKKARIDSRSHVKRRELVEDGARFPRDPA
jgi:carbonic anhydrase/acetyltransferase-like protein (isoleucine patch superfamily)